MKKYLLKGMLVAVALFTGSTVWTANAQTTDAVVKMTYVNGSDNALDTSYGEVSSAVCGYLKLVNNSQVDLGNKDWGVNNIIYLQVDASSASGNVSKATLKAHVTGSADGNRDAQYGVGFNTSEWSANLTWNTADRTITNLTSSPIMVNKGQEEDIEMDITEAFAGDEDKIVTLIVYQVRPGGGNFQNPTVTVETVEGAIAEYTILYYDLDGNELKDPRTATGVVGEKPAYKETDLASIYIDGEKYVIENIYDGITIADDGSTELVLEFRPSAIYSYTLTNQFGDVINEGTGFEEETVSVPYPKYVFEPGTNTLLEAPRGSAGWYLYSMTLDADGATGSVDYTQGSITNVYYYTELESIAGMTETSSANHNVRCSNGAGGFNESGEDIVLTGLPAGNYNIHVGIRGTSKGTVLTVLVGDQTLECTVDGNMQDIAFDVKLTSDGDVVIPQGNGSSNNCYDYIYIRELPMATYDYVVMSSVGDYEVTGDGYAEETATVPFPQFIIVDGTLYTMPAIDKQYNYTFELYMPGQEEVLGYGVATRQVPTGEVDEGGNPVTVPEEIHDAVFYSEAEDIDGTTLVTNGNANIRCSMSAGAFNGGEEPLYVTTLLPGTYHISAQVWGNQGTTFVLTAGSYELGVETKGYINSAGMDVTLTSTTDLMMQPVAGGSGRCIDWILVTGTPDGGAPTGITEIGRTATSGSVYDLQGRRIDNRQVSKGIYIVNGKKVVR